jgi:TRAP-type C4-dicarboxylate transport system permease large subunit
MLFKAIILILLFMIVVSLGQALYHMMRKDNNPDGVVRSLTIRIGLSVLLFILILFGSYMGWITPHALT